MRAYYADKIIIEDEVLEESYLLVDNNKIVGYRDEIIGSIPIVPFKNSIIFPGFIDIHTHGALGYEPGFGTRDQLKKWCNFKLKNGVTGFLPSTTSVPLSRLQKAVENIRALKTSGLNLLGMHMEGPFFAKGKKIGAQNPENVRNNFSTAFKKLLKDNNDIIRYLALDPLVKDSAEIVKFCVETGIKIAAGHSEILYQDFLEKKNQGYSAITHTFNGMLGLHHRQPGLAYAGCMDQDLYAEIICDGFHVSYPMLELFFKLKNKEKAVLITDSMLATGMPPGSSYKIGGIEVTVNSDGKVCKEDGNLAGSTLTMDQAVRNLADNTDLSLSDIIQMASLNPAKLLGIDNNKGSLAVGKDADFIVLNQDLKVEEVFIGGEEKEIK